ncbi:MAG: NAD-dependent epimerase/dehydratase family protein [Magnetococcales bacterium]|nr:NAD-dependent epimerase/dehydratase family protein [Magnetococcales bacterium]
MRIVVIGGTGFIGVNLVGFLSNRGDEVSVYHRKSASLDHLQPFDFKSVPGEMYEEDKLKQVISGCDVVYNLAACPSSLKKDEALRNAVNIVAPRLIARLTREAGARLVHVSSIAAIGAPSQGEIADETFIFNNYKDSYAFSKHLGDKEIAQEVAQGLHAVIVCPGNVVGGRAIKQEQKNKFQSIANGTMKIYPPGGVCLTDVDDLVKGMALAAQKGKVGSSYILGGHNVKFKDYFGQIAIETGSKQPWIRLPEFLLPLAGLCFEILYSFLKTDPPLNRVSGAMVSKNLYYSSKLAETELGYVIGDWKKALQKAVQGANIERKSN